jgi:PTH1 family peptidyl-tRNA hydrolase
MTLLVGLGNPGKQYEKTRHNAGFMVLDKMSADFKFNKKFNAEVAALPPQPPLSGGQQKIILAKPQTFMNLSGQAVQAIMSYYKISPEDLTVIHDDLDIPLGEYKIQKNRSSAGHNGVQSIIDSLGTQDFTRVRIGIQQSKVEGRRLKVDAEKYVLEKFNKNEFKIVEEVIEKIIAEIIEQN